MLIKGLDYTDSTPHYIKSNLFSRMRFDEYKALFHRNFEVEYLKGHIDLEALRFRSLYPRKWKALLDKGFREIDLLLSTIVCVGKMRPKPLD
jgi:hypothetical protein